MSASSEQYDTIITDYLELAVLSSPTRKALISYNVSENARIELTYAELDKRVVRMAAGLAAMGVQKSDVVSYQLPNGWQMTALHLACVRIGAIFNPLMPIFR